MSEGRVLAALLASPPTSSGTRTLNKVSAALALTNCTSLVVANLFAQPAPDLPALTELAASKAGWLAARHTLAVAISDADELLLGWGLDPLAGPARLRRASQITWVVAQARQAGHTHAWTIAGQARHPSRWHQYVSDRHGRTGPGDFQERLRQVLLSVPLASLATQGSHRTPTTVARRPGDLAVQDQ